MELKAAKVYFELTNLCNFKCDFCPLPDSTRKGEHMELSLFEKGVDEIAAEGIAPKVGFHILGEPLLSPILVPAIQHARSRGIGAEITTNGSLLLANVEKVIEADPTKITISIQSSDEKDHKSRVSGISFRNYYDGMIEAIRRIKESPCQAELRLCLMNTRTKKFFSLDRPLGIDEEGEAYAERFARTIRDVYQAIGRTETHREIREALSEINLDKPTTVWIDEQIAMQVLVFGDWGNAFTTQQVYPTKIGACGDALNEVGVLVDGSVTLCCVDYDGGTTLGNLHTDSLPRSSRPSRRAGSATASRDSRSFTLTARSAWAERAVLRQSSRVSSRSICSSYNATLSNRRRSSSTWRVALGVDLFHLFQEPRCGASECRDQTGTRPAVCH